MIITNVGIKGDSLINNDGLIEGRGTVYSKDEDTLALEYEDDFEFSYDYVDGFVNTNLEDDVFGEYIEVIESKLVDNLLTNFI